MNRWTDTRDCISPMFKFSQTARRVMYTTNAIESLNRGRTAFPNAVGLTKALYRELTKKWTSPFEIGGRSTRSWPFCIPAG